MGDGRAAANTQGAFWRVVLAGAAIAAIAGAVVEVVPIRLLESMRDRGLDRSAAYEPLGIKMAVALLAAVLAGYIADRWGAGRVVAVGVLVSMLSVELFRLTAPGLAWNAVAVLFGIGAGATGVGLLGSVVAQCVPAARRLLAVALLSAVPLLGSASWQLFTLTSGSDTGPLITLIGLVGIALSFEGVNRLIETFQWKGAVVVAAALVLLCLPLRQRKAASTTARGTVRAGLAQRNYWLLGLGSLLAGMSSFATVHLYGFLTVYGLTLSQAANALGSSWLAYLSGGLAGVLVIAVMQEATLGLLLTMLACGRAVAFTCLMLLPGTSGWISMSLFILGACLLPVAPASVVLTARLSGTRWLATLFGVQFALYGAGSGLGVYATGFLLDRWNSPYEMLWLFGCLTSLIAAAACFSIKERATSGVEQREEAVPAA